MLVTYLIRAIFSKKKRTLPLRESSCFLIFSLALSDRFTPERAAGLGRKNILNGLFPADE
jgi:hypothetical protein